MNQNLRKTQQQIREETIEKVQSAIQFIRENEGDKAPITASKILLYSEVSRTVLYKPHILKLWNEYLWQKRYGNKENKYYEKELKALQIEKESLELKLQKAEARIHKLQEQLEEEKALSKGQSVKIKRLEEENSVLLGHIELLNSKLNARGLL
ncbi:hypothetical protein [Paenibacillus naphthalenovorans]|uniref:Uncharacterized protein n=1 Tax=Paenibacillus naphthalenovorans TaxID=162209 RepID=A0A0U2MY21_9BACL|nr:hypothetical protein [Paenibacillus naphthalenovorans]ALS23183.1 hypothetical protein IJ22_28100 [Paenibacillus naphthalenovorans]